MSKSFYFLWSSTSFGRLGNSIYMMTLTMIMYQITNSVTFAALVTFTHVIAKLLSSFFIPMLTDRYPLNHILRSSLIGQSLLLLIIIYIFYFNPLSNLFLNVIVFLIIFCIGFLDGLTNPSRNSLTPKVVEKDKLSKANSLISTTDQSFALLGWSMGGVAFSYFGSVKVLSVSLFLYILSALLTFFISESFMGKGNKKADWKSIKIGWQTLYTNQNLRIITLMDIIEGIAGGIWIGGISLVFVKEVLNKNEQWWGYINASYYLGSIIGGILIALISTWVNKNLTRGIMIGSFGVCILVLLYSLTEIPIIALILVAIMGPFYQLRDIAQNTYFQFSVSEELLPKVYAAQNNIYYIVFSLSVFLMGLISDLFGAQFVYLLAAILYFLSSTLIFRKNFKQAKKTEVKISG
ncbi:MFS transporter [Bacillus sp. ZJS3]|uniref:MFS transporter n=1 Tax=Bacillus sp. ZJS3 TaxID=2928154 RepID=UPI00222827BA|nr:MFS transporter [Bacillus sp. ZJS3]